MAYELRLNQDAQLIEAICSDDLSFEEIQILDAEIVAMLDACESDHIHLLTDITHVQTHPNNMVKVWSYTKPIAFHPKLGTWYVMGSHNPFTQFLVGTISRLGKMTIKTVANYDEVLTSISHNA